MPGYSSVNAILGAKGQRKTERAARKAKPTYTTVSAATGAKSYASTASTGATSSSSSAPTSTSSSSSRSRGPSPAQVRKRKINTARKELKKGRKEREKQTKRVTRKPKTRLLRADAKHPSKIDLGLDGKQKSTSGAFSKPPKRESPKIQGPKEKRVARRLKKAAKRSQGGLASKIDRGFAPGEKLTPRQTAIVFESEGLPGITFSKAIVPGESGHQPGVRNPGDNTPSLSQITPSVQSAETRAKFDKIASKRKGGYSNPIVAAKQSKVLAGDSPDGGVSNYVAFNPSAPQGHLKGGEKRADRILYGKKKPIPTKLKRTAERVLGEKATKKVVKQAKTPTTPEKRPGPWAGAQRAVLSAVPKGVRAEGRGDKRTPAENVSVGGSSTSDHLTTNEGSYAADLPPDDAVAKKIAKKLGMASHTGTNEVTKDGYRYQLIWQDAGHYDHIHLGAVWTGEDAPPGTSFGGPVGASLGSGFGGTSTTTSGGKGTTTTPQKAQRRSASDKRRKQLLNEIITKGVGNRGDANKKPATTEATTRRTTVRRSTPRKVRLGL